MATPPCAAEAVATQQQQQEEDDMPIGNAVQRGSPAYVYDERERQLTVLSAGTGPRDGLRGYTRGTVNSQRGATIYTYDERGSQLSATSAR